MIRILIVDDEAAAGNILTLLIEKHIPVKKEIRYCADPQKALELLPVFQPSLVMLDIDMPGMNGFDFLNQAGEASFDVIFTTAYDQYAIKAIRFSALDYLLKPIDVVELQNAIHRHIVRNQYPHHQQQLFSNLIENLQQGEPTDFKLALSIKEGVFRFELRNIICLEGQNNYTRFLFANHKPLLISKTLGEYQEILQEHHFLRVHKSFLVNKSHVRRIDNDGFLELSNNSRVPVSRRRKNEIVDMLDGTV